jgi:cbb3-type cytochrome oxidase subunit 3
MNTYFLLSKPFIFTFTALFIILFIAFMFYSFRATHKESVRRNTVNQLKKNIAHIHQIIKGHYEKLSLDIEKTLLENSEKWFIQTQEEIYSNASKVNSKKLESLINSGTKYDWPLEINSDNAKKYKVFLSNVFTEPFPSLHDMPEFHLHNKFTEMLVLSGIKQSDSRRYGVHIKNHMVNHDMVQGVIQFDILIHQ